MRTPPPRLRALTPDALDAARAALRRHDWPAALDLARHAESDSTLAEAHRLDAIAEAAWWLGRLDDCIAAREHAYRLFEEVDEPRRAGQCAVWLWEHHMMAAHPSIAGAWLRRARRALDDDRECSEYGALLLREAESAHGAGDLAAAEERAADAIALARRLRSANLEAEALQTAGRILIEQGDVAAGMGHLDEAMLFAVEGRLGPYSTGKVYCSLISACEDVGDFDRAAEWTDATLRWAEQHPFAIFPGICRVHRAVVLKRRGELAEAEREASRACDELRHSHLGNSAAAYAEVGDIRRRLGQLEPAEAAFAAAEEISGRACAGLALVRLAQGRVDAAASIVTACLRDAANRIARGNLLPLAVEVALAKGDLDGARRALAELEGIAAEFGTALLKASVLSARGAIELAAGEPASLATLPHAVAAWQALDIPYEVATAWAALARAQEEFGDAAAAAESAAAAAALFERIGACLDRVSSRPPLPAGLTDRELEVLRLIAAGMTNNEIAGALFLSAKTVSRHLSNIFVKIGVNSRSAATAFAFEHELVGG